VEALTARQKQVVEIIAKSIHERGYPPTLREIGKIMGIGSTNGVTDHIRALIRKGFLVKQDVTARGLRLTRAYETGASASPDAANIHGDSAETIQVPVVSRLVPGAPLQAEFVIDTVMVDPSLLYRPGAPTTDVFGLRMRGDAMTGAGIVDGDYVFVRPQRSADNGDIAVVFIGDDAMVRRYYRSDTQVRLDPANKSMASIYLRSVDLQPKMIAGVVVGIFRRIGPVSRAQENP